MTAAYPLHWPDHWDRTAKPKSSQFKTTLAGALKNVNQSIRLFSRDSGKEVQNVIISSNVTLGEQSPKDGGVAVWFQWDEISTCIAVDRYVKVEENLQAIHHLIEAERIKLRHGGLNPVRASFRGYAGALPPPKKTSRVYWRTVLEYEGESEVEANQIYKRMRSKYHPDRPDGDSIKFQQVEEAWKDCKAYFARLKG